MFREYGFIQQARVRPKFYDASGLPCARRQGMLYVYIDGFGGWILAPTKIDSSSPAKSLSSVEAQHDLSVVVTELPSRLRSRQLDVRNRAIGLTTSLGYETVEHETVDSEGRVQYSYSFGGSDSPIFPLVCTTV